MDTPTLPILLGAGTVAAILWGRRRRPSAPAAPVRPPGAPPPPLPGRWVWPVPIWRGRRPVISSGWGTPRGSQRHEGVDLMFARVAADPFPVRSPHGSKNFVMPDDILAVAAADGKVWSADWTRRGFSVVLDHGETGKIATYYTHLEKLLVAPTARGRSGQRVRAGDPLGIIGADPMDGNHLKHLHFALWRGGPQDAVDPQPLMTSWSMIPDPRVAAQPAPEDLRNAGLIYRPVGARGQPYPFWLRALRGSSGVYVIRERRDGAAPETVYVGQSQAGKLYETLTRHFQTWRRFKGFWRGQFGHGHDPGLTYRRDLVDVAVRTTSPSRARDEEARLIRTLRPRDNLIGQPPALDDAPF
jgi:Peptidase family M23